MKGLWLGLLLTFTLPASLAGTAERTSTRAGYASTPTLQWPGAVDREAMVRLRLTIGVKGQATDIELAPGGFHEKRFVDAAITSAKHTRFKPATVDGVPVAITVVIPFAFHTGQGKGNAKWATGVTPEFRTEAKKVEKFFKDGDYAGADFHAEWMLREKVRFGYEYAALKSVQANTHALVGHGHDALRAAEEATERSVSSFGGFTLHQPIPPNDASNYILPKPVVVPLLQLRMRVASELGLYAQAMEAWYELAGLEKIPADDRYALLAAEITAALEGDKPLLMKARIDGSSWDHELFRRSFGIRNVAGKVESFALRCAEQHRQLEYLPGNAWRVPATWNDCAVVVTGEKGTLFEFMEFTEEAGAAEKPAPLTVPQ